MSKAWRITFLAAANYHVYSSLRLRNRSGHKNYLRTDIAHKHILPVHWSSLTILFPLLLFNVALHSAATFSSPTAIQIVLHLWEWPLPNPQRSQWHSTQSSSERNFHLQCPNTVLLFDHRTTYQAESTAQFKQTYTPQRKWHLHYHCNAVCLTKLQSLCRAKEQEVWTRMLFKSFAISTVQITMLWWQLWDWTVCWMTLGKICLTALYRYTQKPHFACPHPLCVISLTHAIKDYLCWQKTKLSPRPCLNLRAVLWDPGPSCWTNNSLLQQTHAVQHLLQCRGERGSMGLFNPFQRWSQRFSHLQEDIPTAHTEENWPFECCCMLL